jgi:hypothetical protein
VLERIFTPVKIFFAKSIINNAVVLFQQFLGLWIQLRRQFVNLVLSAAILAAEADLLASSDNLQFSVAAALLALHDAPQPMSCVLVNTA